VSLVLAAAACGSPEDAEVSPPDRVETFSQAHANHWGESTTPGCFDPGLYDDHFTVTPGFGGERTFFTTASTASYYEEGDTGHPIFESQTWFTEFRGADGATLDRLGQTLAARVNQLQAARSYWRDRVDVYHSVMGCFSGVCRNSVVRSHHNGRCMNQYIVKVNIAPRTERKYHVEADLEHQILDQGACEEQSGAAVPYVFVEVLARECSTHDGVCRTRAAGGGASIGGVWRSGRCDLGTDPATYVAPIGWRTEWLKLVTMAGVGHVAAAAKVRIRHVNTDGIVEVSGTR
jgi:hypothetical protein